MQDILSYMFMLNQQNLDELAALLFGLNFFRLTISRGNVPLMYINIR
jgi:hypothetical protein